jgi:hypothetical protein
MKGLFKKINADKIIRLGTYASLAFLVFHLLYICITFSFLPPFLPLFNQMPWGGDRLGVKIEIFLPFIIGLSFFCLNLVLALRLYEKMPLASRILSITSLIINILFMIFIIRTIQLII